MKRIRFRKLICASAIGLTLGAATLGTSVLSEAAGPRQMFSSLWNRRPTLNTIADSKLNPRTWGTPTKEEKPDRRRLTGLVGGSSSTSGTADSSSRPELYEDPFALSGERSHSASDPNSLADITRKSTSEAAPSPRQRREAERSKLQRTGQRSVFDGQSTNEDATPSGERQVVRRIGVPKLPDGLEGTLTERSSDASRGNENQFSDGFDREFQRLVNSVIAESEKSASSATESSATESSATELTSLDRTGGRDSFRGPVAAPRLDASATEGQSPLKGSTVSVNELIESSRRNMATAMTLPPDAATSPLITSRPGQSSVSLTEATSRQPLLPLDGHPAMMVPAMGGPGGSLATGRNVGAADLRNGWSGQESQARPIETEPRVRAAGPIRPRVISNGAPPQSVPNNRQYERTSYNSNDEGPLFGNVVEALPRAAGGQDELAATDARNSEAASSAPIIDWSLDADSSEPATAGSIPWGFASILVTALTTLLAILLLRKRQVVTVVTSGTDATRESV
ncbi:MAG: hypothetical protein O2820_03885 [Planctomycetota bacterium]|nr:hypothetical protein [Planctomycetota bacterium]MDA1248343.1 hypothetical protein [Planctomycetota bacterium]